MTFKLGLVEYTNRGRLDRSFGNNGVDQLRFGASAIGFDATGDAIVVGALPDFNAEGPAGVGVIARYTRHGPDCSFGSRGVVIDNAMGGASVVAVQPNGRIVVAGRSRSEFAAARYMGGGVPRTCRS
jgi:hypothetical protein